MKKIPTAFVRDPNTKLITPEFTPGCHTFVKWGTPTVKIDGTSCMFRGGVLYRRHTLKKGKTAPENFEEAQGEPDPITGQWPGWIPVGTGTEDQWHREALLTIHCPINGTYELIGPKIQGNSYDMTEHRLVLHGNQWLFGHPETFDEICKYLEDCIIEGIVWWYKNEPVCKVKRTDFGFAWPVAVAKIDTIV